MAHDTLIKELQELGLNIYEAKIYLALLQRHSLGTAEVARLSGVPRARTYDILDNLVARGLASLKPGKQKRFSAIDLETFRLLLINDTRQQCSQKESQIDQAVRKLKEKIDRAFSAEDMISDPLEYIEVIKNPFQIHSRFHQLVNESKDEILIFTKPPYAADKEQLKEQFAGQARLIKKGVKIRSIYEIPKDPAEKTWWIEAVKYTVGKGEEARVIAELPMKMAVFDERIVIYALEDPILRITSVTTMVIEHRSMAKSLKILFETIWDKSSDYHMLTGNEGR